MNKTVLEIAKRYGIFCVLFVWLLWFVLTGYEKREGQLMEFLQTQSITNAKIATTLEKLDLRMSIIESRLQSYKD